MGTFRGREWIFWGHDLVLSPNPTSRVTHGSHEYLGSIIEKAHAAYLRLSRNRFEGFADAELGSSVGTKDCC